MQREAAQAVAQAPLAESAAHACIRRLSLALLTEPVPRGLNADCVAGGYAGVDARGNACHVQISPTDGRFRFVEAGRTLSVEVDVPARREMHMAYALERADVELGHLGLLLSRRDEKGRSVERLTLVAGERNKGPADLRSASYEQIAGDRVRIVRCFFDI